MPAKRSNGVIFASLMLVVVLWGANNVATKYLVTYWPPGFVGSSRLILAGLLFTAIFKWTGWLGKPTPLTPAMKRGLWWRGSLSLAIYIFFFNLAMHFTTASHVALYLGMAPIWALICDHPLEMTWRSAQRYGAAALAFLGVLVLCWPKLRAGGSHWAGEALGVAASVMWTNYGIQCRKLGELLSGAEISAHTMWRAGVILSPVGAFELWKYGIVLRAGLFAVQVYCVIAGGVAAYALWNNALRHWPTSQVYLFNNLIPISTMLFANFCLGEPMTATFWIAMVLVVLGVVLGQGRWRLNPLSHWFPPE